MRMTASVKLYGAIMAKEIKRAATYRSNIYAGVVSAIFMLGFRYALWRALYLTGNAAGSTLSETMTYFIINDVLTTLFRSRHSDNIGADIRSGNIAGKLVKPYSYQLRLRRLSTAKQS